MQVSFGSMDHQAYTNNGNPYIKTYSGKAIGAATLGTVSLVNHLVNIKNIGEAIKQTDMPISKSGIAIAMIFNIALATGIGAGIGSIIDHFRNKSRQIDADNAAIYNKRMQNGDMYMTQNS